MRMIAAQIPSALKHLEKAPDPAPPLINLVQFLHTTREDWVGTPISGTCHAILDRGSSLLHQVLVSDSVVGMGKFTKSALASLERDMKKAA